MYELKSSESSHTKSWQQTSEYVCRNFRLRHPYAIPSNTHESEVYKT